MIPVIAIAGFLGAGKTTLLNHLLSRPGTRAGVIVNDFGRINVDAALITGQVDDVGSIAGGCICCLPQGGGLAQALTRLCRPSLSLDVIFLETSGAADPISVRKVLHQALPRGARFGGLIDVVDATGVPDRGALAPARFAAATLVVINKVEDIATEKSSIAAELEGRIRHYNPGLTTVKTANGRVDPGLIFDTAVHQDDADQLPIAALARAAYEDGAHQHFDQVTVDAYAPIDARKLIDLLYNPPQGAYRLKGQVRVIGPDATHRFSINMVGGVPHLAQAISGSRDSADGLVAIGMDLDTEIAARRMTAALQPWPQPSDRASVDRLWRLIRLSNPHASNRVPQKR